jgi:PAS domain S-box-containing protein
MANDTSSGFHDFSQIQVLPRYYFFCCDGRIIKNPIELPKAIRSFKDHDFRHHVNPERNDFSNWINDVFGGDDLAAKIRHVYDKGEMIKVIEDYFSERLMMESVNKHVMNEDYEKSQLAVIITDAQANIIYSNPAVVKLTGFTKEELKGRNPRLFKSDKQSKETYQTLWSNITNRKIFHSEMINKAKDGHLIRLETTVAPVVDDKNKLLGYIAKYKTIEDPYKEVSAFDTRVQDIKKRKEFNYDEGQASNAGAIKRNFVEEYDKLYERTSQSRKKGLDTKIVELKLMRVGPKIRIFNTTQSGKDAQIVSQMLEDVQHDLDELIQNV